MTFETSFDAWHAVVDALAEELSAMPRPRRAALIRTLMVRGGYEFADPATDRLEETRRALLHGLADRLADTSHLYVRANAA